MKKLVFLMAYAAVIFIGASCTNDFGDLDKVVPPVPQDTTTVKPDTTEVVPETPDTTTTTPPDTTTTTPADEGWRWSTVVAQTVGFDTTSEIVTAENIAQLTKQSGETKLDTARLSYQFGVEATAPTRILTSSKELTVYTGKGLPKSDYSNWNRSGKDSIHTVTTVVEGGFKTQYYTVSLTTTRKEGYSLHAGKWLAYKNVSENSQMTVSRDTATVLIGDSIFLREKVTNTISITLRSEKGSWTVKRVKTVIVDHFLRIKEEEVEEPQNPAEPEKVEADYWVDGLGRLVCLSKVLREDYRYWCDAALFEGSKGYTMVIDTYDTEDKFLRREKAFVSYSVCPKTNDYDGVAYINGAFYPAAITYNPSSRGWVLITVVNGEVLDQNINSKDAVNRGIKNFKENNTAYPWPYMTNTSTTKTVDGKKVINVSGKTSTRAYRGCVVADTLLKK